MAFKGVEVFPVLGTFDTGEKWWNQGMTRDGHRQEEEGNDQGRRQERSLVSLAFLMPPAHCT